MVKYGRSSYLNDGVRSSADRDNYVRQRALNVKGDVGNRRRLRRSGEGDHQRRVIRRVRLRVPVDSGRRRQQRHVHQRSVAPSDRYRGLLHRHEEFWTSGGNWVRNIVLQNIGTNISLRGRGLPQFTTNNVNTTR